MKTVAFEQTILELLLPINSKLYIAVSVHISSGVPCIFSFKSKTKSSNLLEIVCFNIRDCLIKKNTHTTIRLSGSFRSLLSSIPRKKNEK